MNKVVTFTRPDENGDREISLHKTADGLFHVSFTGFNGKYVTNYGERLFNNVDNARVYANQHAKKLVADGWTMLRDTHTTYEVVRKTLTLMTGQQLSAIDEYTTAIMKAGIEISATALKALAEEIQERTNN